MEVLSYLSENKMVEIKIATSSIVSSWERFRQRVPTKATSYCDYKSSCLGFLSLTNFDTMGETAQPLSDNASTEWTELPPVFYETNVYTFTIRFQNIEGKPTIIHPNREIVEQFNYFQIGENAALITGSIDFINEPGIFPLKFRYKPIGSSERTDWLEFRVVSPKLDTKDDYHHILNAINIEYENLVYKYLTKTFQNFKRGGIERNNLIWLSIFRDVITDYIKAMEYIVNKPHIKEQKQKRFSKADHIHRWTPRMEEEYARAEIENILEHKLFRHEISISTSDTRENRFVKYTIENIGKRLNNVISELKQNFGKYLSEDENKQLTAYQSSLIKLSRNRFFRNIGNFDGFRQESLVLQKKTGYTQIYRTWFILNSGLSLYQGNTQIGTRPIWELYELWCFLKMKQLVANILDIDLDPESDDYDKYINEDKSTMLDPFKKSEVEHIISFHKNEDTIELRYQHTYNRHNDEEIHTATTEQRPDIVLNIIKPDGFTLTYLYDAKYRVLDDKNKGDMDDDETEYADYPPSDAINQMHRYRDAIYYGRNRHTHSAKEIIGGYILFPGRTKGEKVRDRYFFKSIEKVNIGAFPLLPSKDEDGDILLKEHLTKVLLNKSKFEQIEGAIPQRGLFYTTHKEYPNDMILVGYVKNDIVRQQHLDAALYYVRAGFSKGSMYLKSGFEASKYLLLHNGYEGKRWLYKLDENGPRIISGKDLSQKYGFDTTEPYYMAFGILSKKGEIHLEGVNIETIQLPHGNAIYSPYFTTIEELLK